MANTYSLIFLVFSFFAELIAAQTSLPATSRTVFRCNVDGKVIYTDAPCLGAKKINVEPTRGLNKSSGRELIGADVQKEKEREMFADAIQPVTGMNAKEFATFGRRMKLPPEMQKECNQLDVRIPAAESAEKSAGSAHLTSTQEALFVLRKRFQEIRC
jgi:hypothetical protein